MLRFILTRIALVIPTFIGMTLLAFFLIRLVPGDPIETLAGERGIDPVRHAVLAKEYGLDRPLLVQYGLYVERVLHGDLGKSMITQASVVSEFRALFPAIRSRRWPANAASMRPDMRRCSRNTASTGRCWCNTASTSAACCTAISASR